MAALGKLMSEKGRIGRSTGANGLADALFGRILGKDHERQGPLAHGIDDAIEQIDLRRVSFEDDRIGARLLHRRRQRTIRRSDVRRFMARQHQSQTRAGTFARRSG